MAVVEKPVPPAPVAAPAVPGAPVVPPKRSPGHRGADVKDTVAEMAAKAHEISLEAGSKMAAAMKDVINGAAGITGFVVESARDLVQFMVRRGQMTQDEADKLMREAEEFQSRRKPRASSASAKSSSAKPVAKKPAAKKPAAKPARAKAARKPAPKKPAKAARKPAPKKPAKFAKRPAAHAPKPKAKLKPKPKAKSSAKSAKSKRR